MPSEVSSPTARAAIYARYSSDNQREASIEDQVEVCRRRAELQGWEIVEVYPDRALSGASRFRLAFQQMQVDAEARRFDVIIVEALDPLSRKLADMAELHDRLTFPEIRLHAVNAGEITPMHAAVLGMMAQAYSNDLAEKTKPGQLGRARVLTESQINPYGPHLGTKERPVKRRELQKIGVRLPPDVHEWISAQAERNQSSINSEIIRAIRNAMDRQVDRQVPCTTPPHDRSGNGS